MPRLIVFLRSLFAAALLLAVGATTLHAQTTLQDDPGYVDLSRVATWFDAEPSVKIDIEKSLLSLVSSASESSNPQFARLLREMKAIQVRSYPLNVVDAQALDRQIGTLSDELRRIGWTPALVVREQDESVRMFIRQTNDERIAGLTVLSVDPADDEAVFVNIVGPLHPDDLERLGDALDVDVLDGIRPIK